MIPPLLLSAAMEMFYHLDSNCKHSIGWHSDSEASSEGEGSLLHQLHRTGTGHAIHCTGQYHKNANATNWQWPLLVKAMAPTSPNKKEGGGVVGWWWNNKYFLPPASLGPGTSSTDGTIVVKTKGKMKNVQTIEALAEDLELQWWQSSGIQQRRRNSSPSHAPVNHEPLEGLRVNVIPALELPVCQQPPVIHDIPMLIRPRAWRDPRLLSHP